jgi:hypothetical protein
MIDWNDQNVYRVDSWAVNVDNGVYFHNCAKRAMKMQKTWFRPTDNHITQNFLKNRLMCKFCGLVAGEEVQNKLFVGWRMFHIREQKTYVDHFYVTGVKYPRPRTARK